MDVQPELALQLARSEIPGAVVDGLAPGELTALVHDHEHRATASAYAKLPPGCTVRRAETRTYELAGDPDGVGVEVLLWGVHSPPNADRV